LNRLSQVTHELLHGRQVVLLRKDPLGQLVQGEQRKGAVELTWQKEGQEDTQEAVVGKK
jgi:hypothetical protein